MFYFYYVEFYLIYCIGWLRVVVLGVNDGIILVISLIMGMVVSGVISYILFIMCIVGFILGVSFMVVGEYILVKF